MGASLAPAAQVGVVLGGELGVVLGDRLALGARVTVGYGLAALGSLELGAEYAVTERISLGLGAAPTGVLGMLAGSARVAGLLFPLRVSLRLSPRAETELARRGVVLSAEVAPGFTFAGSQAVSSPLTFPGFGIAGSLTVGYSLF